MSVTHPEARHVLARPRYLDYRPSGVDGLGDMPAHWELKRLRFIAQVSPPKDDINHLPPTTEVSFLPMEAISEDGQLNLDSTRPIGEVQQGYTYGREGDVVVAKITPCFENGKGALLRGLRHGLAFGTTELHVLRATSLVHPKFLYLVTVTHRFRSLGQAAMTGAAGQQRVPDDFVKNYEVPLPPLQEQRAIVSFLDNETADIETLVEKKHRLIALLEEKRAALIAHAVTKGLDPTAPMTDSGVVSLGEIPAHWDVKRIRDLAVSLQTGPFGSQLHFHEYVEGGIPLVNPSHMIRGRIQPDAKTAVDEATAERLSRHYLETGDIVFARRGEMGRCALVTGAEVGWLCGTGSIRMRPRTDLVLPEFLIRVLATGRVGEWLALESVGATMDNLNTSIIGRLPLPVPPLGDQRRIVAHLDYETAKIDALIAKLRETIARLGEYRTALIAAAVTGQIDVRGAGAALG